MATNANRHVRAISGRGVVSLGFLALATATMPLGCGDDDPAGTAGSSGKGGSGGKAGSGGKGGSAGATGGESGSGGKGGSSGGKGGAGGKAGTGGDAGAGNGGGAGTGGAGSGGSAGSGGGTGGDGGDDSGGAGHGGEETGGVGAGGAPPLIDPDMSPAEWAIIETLGPLGAVPPDPTNAYADNAAAAALGQKFFFEKDFSGPLADLGTGVVNDLGAATETGKVACASCHFTNVMMSDHRSSPTNVSLGANFHSRNAPGMVNSSFYPWTNWGGRFSRQWELPMPVTESGVILNSTRLRVAHVIFDQYKADYEAVFGAVYGAMEPAIGTDLVRFPANAKPKANSTDPDGPWELMAAADRTIITRIFVNYAKALAAYTRTLVSRNAPFDNYVAGDFDAISVEAKRGLKLFIGSAGCVSCHSGPHLSDGAFHNIGVAQTGPHVPASDDGRFKDIPPLIASGLNASSATWSDDPAAGAALITPLNPADEANRAAFRTPSLRGVSDTGPYMHSGQLATLADVIDFYERGGDTPAAGTKVITPLTLSATDKSDLVAFLGLLTGEAVPSGLRTDTSQ